MPTRPLDRCDAQRHETEDVRGATIRLDCNGVTGHAGPHRTDSGLYWSTDNWLEHLNQPLPDDGPQMVDRPDSWTRTELRDRLATALHGDAWEGIDARAKADIDTTIRVMRERAVDVDQPEPSDLEPGALHMV